MANQYSTSAACQTAQSRTRTRASPASGSSQSTYCGEYTLLVRQNAATVRKPSAARPGVTGARQATSATAASSATKAATATGSSGWTVAPSRPRAYQSEPKSAGRPALNRQNSAQPAG